MGVGCSTNGSSSNSSSALARDYIPLNAIFNPYPALGTHKARAREERQESYEFTIFVFVNFQHIVLLT